MILGEPNERSRDAAPRWPTLDDLFRSAVQRRGDALAVADPLDRFDFTEVSPRRLTFCEADRVVTAIADRLRDFGLPTDSVIAIQLPNVVENVLALLGVLRAGLIAAPIPLLWRHVEMVDALSRIGARGIITSRRAGSVDQADIAMHVAADIFSIRFVGVFGRRPPDGVEALDDVFMAAPGEPGVVMRLGDPADHVAVVTFDVTEGGIVPVARSHAELIAGGLAVALESRMRPETTILGTMATSSFAGLASTILPWLISAGTLNLHHPFDANLLAGQCSGARCDTIVIPGPAVARFSEAGLLEGAGGPKIIAVWRAPERRGPGGAWTGPADIVDLLAFGEVGAVPLRRHNPSEPVPLTEQAIKLAASQDSTPTLIEVARIAGMLALAGAMVPRYAFPAGAKIGPSVGPTGFVDTGYSCRIDPDGALLLDGPPAGIINVGGYRFRLRDLNDIVPRSRADGTLAILPDSLAGYRLAGVASDREGNQVALNAFGANALIVAAFGEQRSKRASAA